LKEIYERRSIRAYTGDKLTQAEISSLLKAAMNAPSGMNTQPWQFVVIDDDELIDRFVEYNRFWAPLKSAGVGIVLCGDLTRNKDRDYLLIDIAAATENLIIEAQSMGLATCWLGVGPGSERTDAVAALINAPDTVRPVSMVAVGRPAETKEANDRYLEDRIHRNSF
jgi:nitroreductase